MLKESAEPLIEDLQDAFGKQLSERGKSFYLRRFMECDEAPLRQALRVIVDTREHFPRWAAIREAYGAACARERAWSRRREEQAADGPLTSAECYEIAEQLASQAARLHASGRHALAAIFEESAEAYSARAADPGARLPVWSWIKRIAATVTTTGAKEGQP